MDPYATCPCGSGKKFKFCCQAVVGEMEKIQRLRENNQFRMALQQLEKLDKAHPGNPWVVTQQALVLMAEDRPEEAEGVLFRFLKGHQDHRLANVLYGIAAFHVRGYPEAKRAVHRTFRFATGETRELASSLASEVAWQCLRQGHFMAAREHLGLALRWSATEAREGVFRALVDFDSRVTIPYPMRGPHYPPVFEPPESLRDAYHRAEQLSMIGCWQEAAERLAAAFGNEEQRPEAWHLLGLYWAWDGSDASAADAFHKAAALYEDFETAVECETLAQLLDQSAPEARCRIVTQTYNAQSAGRLLTQLDSHPRIIRNPTPDELQELAGETMVAQYSVIDRDLPAGEPTLESLPRVTATLSVWKAEAEDGAPYQALLTGEEGPEFDAACEVVVSAAGDSIDPPEGDPNAGGFDRPTEYEGLVEILYFPPEMARADVERITHQQWSTLIDETWPNHALRVLGGRAPRDATGESDLRVKLAGAINVLDVVCARHGVMLSIAEQRERFGLPAVTMLSATPETNTSRLSFMQVQRLDLDSLSQPQLEQVLQRATLTRHPMFLHRVMTYVLSRADYQGAYDRQTVYEILADLCISVHRPQEALHWASLGQSELEEGPRRFEKLLHWKLREMKARSLEPIGPEMESLLNELWHHFASKIPELRQILQEVVQQLRIEPPWEHSIITATDLSGVSGTWPATEPAATGGTGKKLWLPGGV